jgi:hypothetical protein
MNRIEILFKEKFLQRGGVTLLSKTDTVQFIRECSKDDIRILGIDGFLLVGDKIQPSLENSIDFTASYAKRDNIYEQALNFVDPIDAQYYFEVVYE